MLEDEGATGDLEQEGMSQALAWHSNGDAEFHAAWAVIRTLAVSMTRNHLQACPFRDLTVSYCRSVIHYVQKRQCPD